MLIMKYAIMKLITATVCQQEKHFGLAHAGCGPRTNHMIVVVSDICSATNADERAVYQFLVHCLVSWVASVIIEFKSCKILSQLSRYDAWRLPKAKGQLGFFLCCQLLSLTVVAGWSMLHFSSAVYMSFEKLFSDP